MVMSPPSTLVPASPLETPVDLARQGIQGRRCHLGKHFWSAVERQLQLPVEYEGEQVAIFYLDLLAEKQVVIEVKAFSHQLTNDELAQVINYLKATGAPVALLFNFGRRKLEYRRVFPGKDVKPVQRIERDNAIKK